MAAMAKALPSSVGCGSSKLNFLDHCHSAPLARLRGGMDTVQLGNEIQQLKAEVVELKAEVERLKVEVVELKDEDTKQTTKARPGPTIVALRTGGGMAHPPVRCGRLFAAAERSIHRVGPGVSGGSRAPPLFPADCSNDRAHAPPLKALQNLINSKLACLRIPLLCWMFVEGVADKAAHVDEI